MLSWLGVLLLLAVRDLGSTVSSDHSELDYRTAPWHGGRDGQGLVMRFVSRYLTPLLDNRKSTGEGHIQSAVVLM